MSDLLGMVLLVGYGASMFIGYWGTRRRGWPPRWAGIVSGTFFGLFVLTALVRGSWLLPLAVLVAVGTGFVAGGIVQLCASVFGQD